MPNSDPGFTLEVKCCCFLSAATGSCPEMAHVELDGAVKGQALASGLTFPGEIEDRGNE